MNQNNCEIARDLMPLSVDGVCSEGSQRFLDGHLAECKPCQDYFSGMKAGMLNIKMEPTQEAKSLKKSLRHMGKRFKALWISLAALLCALVLLLTAAGIQQTLRSYTNSAPIDMYHISIYSNDALVSMGISGSFFSQVYNGFSRDEEYTTLDATGKEAVILTYSVQWFPYQHKEIADSLIQNSSATVAPTMLPFKSKNTETTDSVKELLNPKWNSDYRFTKMLETQQLCMDNGMLYMLAGWDSVVSTSGRTLLVAQPGTPVSEIRVTDGKETQTIYTRGDELPNYTADMLDENGLPQSGFLSPSDLEKYADFIVK